MATDHALLVQLLGKLKNGELVLPTLPAIAISVRDMARDPECSLDKLSGLISQDPALAARMVSLSNSSAFGGLKKNTSVNSAVTRLGLDRTRDLATAAAMQQLFRSSRSLTWELMNEYWGYNVEVAACASAVLACLHEQGRFSHLAIDTMLLAALVHNIGCLPVLNLAETKPDQFAEREQVQRIIKVLKAPVGRAVLLEWDFDAELVEVVHRWADLSYQSPSIGYVDFIRLAAVYSREIVFSDPLPSVLETFVLKGLLPDLELFSMETYFVTYHQVKASFDLGWG